MESKNDAQFSPVEEIKEFISHLPTVEEKIKRNKIFYRGQSSVDYDITPSILRDEKKEYEDKIYNEVMTECAHEFDECKLHNEILSKMQHYGVPTRLLDVTTNPLVALYFACQENKDKKDGVVYVIITPEEGKIIDYSQFSTFPMIIKQYDSDAVSILSSLPRFSYKDKYDGSNSMLECAENAVKNKDNDKDDWIKKFNLNDCIKRLLHEIKKEKPAFENIINPHDLLSNFILIPRKTNARIIRQSGAFIIFGLKNIINKNNFDKENIHYSFSYRIIVKKDKKKDILDQLSCYGISKATLYPELYKVAEYIKENPKKIFG